ncbi:MAG: hypothetical protein ABUL60_18495 [Myxococcales bacterium]
MIPTDEQSPHRLFAAIVLMGTGLAVGCGGISETQGPLGSSGRTSVASAGSGSTTSSGGGDSVGPATSTGGAPHIDIGTTMGGTAPATIEPGPFACPPQQWACVSADCDYQSAGWKLPDSCPCDPKKPLSASDCQPDQLFLCQHATANAEGRVFTTPVPLSCTCVPKSTYVCRTECEVAYGRPDLACVTSDDQLSATCGCAVIFLK